MSSTRRVTPSPLSHVFRNLLIAAAALLLWRGEARATHAMGGELTYSYLGANQYLVTLNFYRDCNGVAAPTNCGNGLEFNVRSTACGANFNQCLSLQSVQIITPICATEIDRCSSASGTYGVEKYVFTKVVNLGAWANCGTDWIISWELCCRNNAITSLQNPGNQRLYLDTRLNNVVTPHNNSAYFTNAPTPFYCLGQPIAYNPGAVDPDGDVLVFDLINARGTGGANLAYAPTYSALQPIHNSGGGNAVVLNSSTGTLTCVPDIQQVAVVSYRVREYRGGVQVGEITRDVQFVVRPCPANTAPTASGINGTGNYSTSVCANVPISFTINSNDVNAGQQVSMAWNSGIPGATFSTAGLPFPTGTFNWTPTTANIGNNVFTVTVTDNACPLVGSADYGYSITVTPPFTPASAGPDQSVCGGTATLAAALPWPTAPHQWTVISGSGSFADPTNPNTTVTGLAQGANVFQWSVDYLTCGIATDQVTITSYNPGQAAANAGPDQALCLPTTSTTLAGNVAAAPAVGTWTLMAGSGTITSPNSPTSGVTGLAVGLNRFRWTINNGPCGTPTFDEVQVLVFNNTQPAAFAGADQSICTPSSSVTLAGNTPIFPAVGTWSLISGPGGSTITSPNSQTSTFTGLLAGIYVLQWSINNGPCVGGITSDQVQITVFSASSPNANAGPDQQICTPGGATLAGSTPTAPATGLWTLVSGSGTITSPTSPSTTVTALGVGINVFQWTVNNGPCANGITSDQVSVTVFDANNPAANAGPDQSLCTPTTSTTLAGNAPIFPATGTWTIVLGSGTIASPNAPNTQVTGLGVGQNTFRWTMSNGPCPGSPSFDEVSIFIFNGNQSPAAAGADQQLCTPASSATLTGNAPIFPATGLWTLVSGSGSIASPTSATTAITGLAVGVNVFQWTINNGPCANPVTSDQVAITVFNAASPAANAGPDQELCTPTLSTTLAGNAPIFPATGQWTLISGSGTITTPASPTSTVTGLAVGENIFQWTLSNGPCGGGITTDQVSVFVFDASNATADAGPNQQLCTPDISATMAGSAVILPAIGTWTLISGGGTITDPNDPLTEITNLPIGVNVFAWTVDNGPCAGGLSTDQVTISVFAGHNLVADAGPDQEICVPTFPNAVNMQGSAVIFPAVGTWTLVSGTGTIVDPNDPNTSVTGLSVGINVFQWTVSNGPCADPLTTDQVNILVFDAANPVADAGPPDSLCTPITSTVLDGSELIAPATGLWTLLGGTGVFADPTDPNTAVSGLSLGVNTFRWTVSNGPCANPVTSDQVTITVFSGTAQQANAGPDQELCSTGPFTLLAGNPVVPPATGTWTLVSGSGTITDPSSASTTVGGLGVGNNVFQWSVDNGACGVSTDQVTIAVYSVTNPVANAGPDQSFCSPTTSTTMAANVPTVPATGTWTLVSGTGNILSPNVPTTGITGLSVGENIFQWTVDNGPCPTGITSDLVSIFIYDATADAADAGPDQQLCTPVGAVTLAANAAVFPASGIWTVLTGTGVFDDATDPTTGVSGLSIGLNQFSWSLDNGPCGSSSDVVDILVFDANNPVADAGPDQELCTPNTTATMAGSAVIFPATGAWSLVSGTGTIVDADDPGTAITGLAIGVHVFEWTVTNGPCSNGITSDQVVIVVYDQNEPPADAGPDQQLCTPVTGTTLQGSTPTFPATGEWSLVQGSGTLADVNDPASGVSGLSVGENIFQWTVDNGPCPGSPSPDQVSIFVFDANNPVADAGPDQSLCTPTTSTTLAGSSVIFPATGSWTLVSGTGTIADPTDPNTTVTGLTVGENIFQWTVLNGPCATPVSNDLVSIYLYDANNALADAGPDQQLCTPDINTTMAGSAVIFPAAGTWTLISGAGTIADPNDPSTTISGLAVGENIFQWTVDNGPCAGGITTDQVSIFLFDGANANADAGPDQELCTPASGTTMAGSAVTFPAVGTWTLLSGTGAIADVNDPNTAITGLTVGENIFQWSVDNGPCTNGSTSDLVSLFVFDANNPDADAGPDQELCTPTTSTVMAGSSVTFPAIGTWTLVSGTGTIVAPNDPTSAIFDLTVGINVFAWTVDNGSCANGITSDTVSIVVYDAASLNAAAGPDQDLCTPLDSALMAASAVIFPSIGTWTVVSGTGAIADVNDPTTMITGLGVGVNVFEWTVDNGPCESAISTDQVTITLYDANNPIADAGPDQSICTPDDEVTMAGSAVIFPAVGTWTLVSGTGTIADPNDPNTVVSGMPVGEHIFLWTVTNGPCANPLTEDLVSIFVYDDGNAVADAGPNQNICTPVTSTTLAGSPVIFPATGQWTLVSGVGTIADPADPNTAVTGLGVGVNVFEWTVDNGPCAAGLTSDQVIILLFDLNAPPAAAGPDQEICAPEDSVSMAGNTPTSPGVGTWTLTQGTGAFADVNDPTTAVTGLSIGENILTWTIDNGICGISSDDISVFVFDPNAVLADAGADVEICVPQDSIVLAGNTPTFPATGTWTQIDGAGLFADVNDPNSLVVGLAIGANTFVWTIDNGPCANPISTDTMTVILYDDSTEAANAGPDLEICLPLTMTNLQAATPLPPADGTWSLIGGTGTIISLNDPNSLVTDLAVGINTFVWTLELAPCPNNGIISDTMTVSVFDPSAPAADAGPDIELCSPTDQATMAGNAPLFPAVGTWSLIQGTGAIADVNDPTTLVTGLSIGENILVWEIYNGNCGLGPNITYDTMSVIVYDPTTPVADAGGDVELCTPTDSVVMQANTILFPSSGTWTLIQGTGTFLDVNDPNTLVTGLTVGENIFQWSVSNGPCPNGSTSDQVSIFLFDQNAPDADAGPDQEICVPTMPNTVAMAGSAPIFPGAGLWTLVSGSGTIVDPTSPTSPITDLVVGVHVFAWSIDNGPCGNSSDEVQIIVFDAASPNANAGPDQELCTPDNATTLAANTPIFPAQGSWTVISGSGTVSDPGDPNSALTGLTVGQTILVWTIDNGPCPNNGSADTVVVELFDGTAADADAGADQQFCSPAPEPITMLANSATFPAIGTWVLLGGSGTIANPNDPATTITGLGLGENVFEWSIDNGDCGSSNDQVSLWVFDSGVPPADAGEGQEFCANLYEGTTLDAEPASSTAMGTWSLISGAGTITDPLDPQSWIYEQQSGANIFAWTITNGPCPSTSDTMIVFLEDCLTLVIPNAFSPNDDGDNDTYVIQNLESYPNNSIQVFNRWGAKVLDRSPYNNDWDGRSENSMNWGEELPESTYYYILDLGDGSDAFTGYIYLKR